MVTIIGPFAFGFELSFIVPPIIKVIIKCLFTIKKDRYYYILTVIIAITKNNHTSSTFWNNKVQSTALVCYNRCNFKHITNCD